MNLGQILKTYREQHNISQSKLGTLLNVDQTYISRIENGERNPTDITFLRRVAEVLQINPS